VWGVGRADARGDGIWRYRLQGIDSGGAPKYDFHHVNQYRLPSQLSQSTRRIEVYGNTVYVSGFSSSDPDPDKDFDGWKSLGRHLLKFKSLPTRSGWPTPAWEHNFSYGKGSALVPYPTSFAADPAAGHIAVSWLFDPKTNQGRIDVLADSDGSTQKTLSPPVRSLGAVGHLDMQHSLEARNGWIWAEDNLQSKVYGLCPSRRCS
jgi:hypothetical protein